MSRKTEQEKYERKGATETQTLSGRHLNAYESANLAPIFLFFPLFLYLPSCNPLNLSCVPRSSSLFHLIFKLLTLNFIFKSAERLSMCVTGLGTWMRERRGGVLEKASYVVLVIKGWWWW